MSFNLFHQDTEKRRELILKGSVFNTLLLLSVPTLLMGLVMSAVPVVDGLFINNIIGTMAASSVTYCTPIINMLVSLSQGLGVAGSAMIGQMNGKGNFKAAKHTSTQIVVFAFILGWIMAPVLVLLAFPISWNVDPQISHNTFVYLALNSLVLPFIFLAAVYNSIKNAAGKPEATFIRMALLLIFKILFNGLFIAILHLGIIGAVMASITSYVLLSLWMYFELFVGKGDDKLSLNNFKFDGKVIRELVNIGIPSMLSNIMLNLGFFLINNEVEKYGPIVLNGQGIAGNVTSICFILPSAFAAAVTTMVSMNVGAEQSDKAKKSYIAGSIVSAITAAILVAIVVPLSSHLTVFFTHDKEVLDIANKSLHIYTYSVVGFAICMVAQGAFIGLGRTKIPLIISILRIWLLRYIFILLTEKYLSFYSVFWGNLFSNYAAALIIVILVMKIKWVSSINLKDAKSSLKDVKSVSC